MRDRIKALCKVLHIKLEDFMADKRKDDLVRCRKIIAYVINKEFPDSFRIEYCRIVNKHPSSIVHYLKSIASSDLTIANKILGYEVEEEEKVAFAEEVKSIADGHSRRLFEKGVNYANY